MRHFCVPIAPNGVGRNLVFDLHDRVFDQINAARKIEAAVIPPSDLSADHLRKEAKEADWKRVRDLAITALESKTKDLRIAASLTEARRRISIGLMAWKQDSLCFASSRSDTGRASFPKLKTTTSTIARSLTTGSSRICRRSSISGSPTRPGSLGLSSTRISTHWLGAERLSLAGNKASTTASGRSCVASRKSARQSIVSKKFTNRSRRPLWSNPSQLSNPSIRHPINLRPSRSRLPKNRRKRRTSSPIPLSRPPRNRARSTLHRRRRCLRQHRNGGRLRIPMRRTRPWSRRRRRGEDLIQPTRPPIC